MFISGLGLGIAILVGWLQDDPARQAYVAAAAVLFTFFGGLQLLLQRVATLLPPGVLRIAIVIVPLAAVVAGLLALRTRPDNWVDFAAAFLLGLSGLVFFSGLTLGLILLWIRFAWRGD
jgi:protein-S-isoprenylcysteine O-methyltransferase Ste14